MKPMNRILIALALGLVVACGGSEPTTTTATAPPKASAPRPPVAAEAKTIVENSSDFSEYQFTNAACTLPMKKSAMNEPARKAAQELTAGGWIHLRGDDVVLSEKAATDKRFLVRPNGYVDIVPIAKKEFGDITAVRPNPDRTVSVDFDWKWIPNEVGQAFKSGIVRERFDSPQHATAKLMWDGKTWTVLRIDERR